MSRHFSQDLARRYRQRVLSPAELIAAADHLAACHECRQMLNDVRDVDNKIQSLRANLEVGSESPRAAISDLEDGASVVVPMSEFEASLDFEHVGYPALEAYVDKTISSSHRKALDLHFKTCTSCSKDLHDLESFQAYLANGTGRGETRLWNSSVQAVASADSLIASSTHDEDLVLFGEPSQSRSSELRW